MLPPKELRTLRTAGRVAASLLSNDDPSFPSVAWDSFLIISAAELFDKTFFIVMILATTHPKWAVFVASSVALLAHVGICASAGVVVAKYVSPTLTIGIIVSVYFAYAILFFIAYWQADRSKPAEEEAMAEARGELEQEDQAESQDPEATTSLTGFWMSFAITFSAVFVGEFGDRTQVAMVGQTSNYPVWPVCLGCSVAFLIQVGISMMAGEAILRLGISKGTLLLTGAISFFVFAIYALYNQPT